MFLSEILVQTPIDSNGLTLDFELRKHRDYAAAYHFLKRLLTTNGRPDRLVTDQYRATLKAVKHLMKQDYLSKSAHQCSKYRNNLIEQDSLNDTGCGQQVSKASEPLVQHSAALKSSMHYARKPDES